MFYTHFAGQPVTESRGDLIDIDGETFRVGIDTDSWDWPLEEYDYTAL